MIIFSRIIKLCRTGLILVIPLLILSGCAAGFQDCGKYAGTDNYKICMASQGDKEMQYQLGLAAYKAMDMDTAIKWLKKAAEPVSDDKMMYMPPVGGQKYGMVTRMPDTNPKPGHPEAQKLLAKIYEEGIGVKKDSKKATRYRDMSLGIRK
ncbi:MAG: sel1 repeat family protein [Kordiimonadaceae bacterium]|nr:sel1 repeat family protein [Kordiimonadaceae bacterium]